MKTSQLPPRHPGAAYREGRAHTSKTRQFARFLVVGGVNTGATVLVFEGLRHIMPYLLAYTLAYVLGIVVAYYLGTGYVFAQRRTLLSASLFPLVYVAQYALGAAIMWALVDRLGFAATLAVCIVVAVTAPVTFFLSRIVIHTSLPRRRCIL